MKKILLFLATVMWTLTSVAQIVTTQPAIVQVDSKNIVITYHADQGNKGLQGLTSATPVYAHTGVITSESANLGDWKHAPTWLDNSAKYKMTYAGANTWTLTIPSIDTYYNISAGEVVEKLMFVFRTATGSQEGKTAQGGDIAVPVYPAGFQTVLSTNLDGQVISGDDAVKFTVNTTASANIKLYVKGQQSSPIATANASTTLTGSKTFSAVGSYEIIAEATPTAGGATVSTSTTVVKLGTSVRQNYPGGVPKMGVVNNADGSVTFCIAAPGKESVVLVPSWLDYQVVADCQMKYQDYQGYRYFWTTVSGLTPSTDYFYYYLVDGTKAVGDPYAHLILDPWSDKYIPSDVFPNLPAYPVGLVPEGLPLAVYNSASDQYDWQVTDFKAPEKSQLIVYELLIRDFTGTEGEAQGNGTIEGVLGKLDYLKSLGINAIELLPIMEFNGNNSWGYNTNFYFAPDKAYGTPNDYRRLIDECHRRGIAVILDIVFNQSDGLHPWYQMYPIAENPFYNASAPHAYSVLNDWKQEMPLVEQQWIDALQYWLSAFKVDGFRFDLVKGLGDSNSYGATYTAATNSWSGVTDNGTNAYNQSRIDRMIRLHAAMKEVNPNAYFINEDLAGSQEENKMAVDGQMNWSNINGPSIAFSTGVAANANLNLFYAPLNGPRYWGSTVSYMESHDEERVVYAVNNETSTNTNIKGNQELILRRVGTVAAQMLMTPGPHMLWQFQEFGADQTTKNDSGNDTSPKTVVWSYLDNQYNEGLMQTYSALNAIRHANPQMFADSIKTDISLDYVGNTVESLVLTNGNSQLVLLVNPNPRNRASNMAFPAAADKAATSYHLLAASYGQNPTITDAKTVSMLGNTFAVFGTDDLTDIDQLNDDNTSGPIVYVDSDRNIVIKGQYKSVTIVDAMGRQVGGRNLSPGFYLVKVDGLAKKLLIK